MIDRIAKPTATPRCVKNCTTFFVCWQKLLPPLSANNWVVCVSDLSSFRHTEVLRQTGLSVQTLECSYWRTVGRQWMLQWQVFCVLESWNHSALVLAGMSTDCLLPQLAMLTSKVKKTSSMLDYERWTQSWSQFLGSQPTGDSVINPVIGCHYFPPGPRLLSQSKRLPPWLVPNYTAWWQRHTGVSSLPKATTQWCTARTRTHDLQIASPLPCQ